MTNKELRKELTKKLNEIDNKTILEYLNVIIETAHSDYMKANEVNKGANKGVQDV